MWRALFSHAPERTCVALERGSAVQVFLSWAPRYDPSLDAGGAQIRPRQKGKWFVAGRDTQARRAKKNLATPHATNTREALKGKVSKRGRVEARGRPPAFTRAMVLRMGSARKQLVRIVASAAASKGLGQCPHSALTVPSQCPHSALNSALMVVGT